MVDLPSQRVETEEMHPDPPGGLQLAVCAIAGVSGVALIVLGAVLGALWGPIRLVFVLAGVVLLLLAILQALGVTKLRIGASGDGGIAASAERTIGYTKTMTVSESLIAGSAPLKIGNPPARDGVMPSKDGVMPSKDGVMPSKDGVMPSKDGVMPSKDGVMPSKDGVMPAGRVEDATPGSLARPTGGETAQDRPKSSAGP
jgi:hypothetical protein